MYDIIAICLLAGALAGLLAGLFGIGGGLVLVPLLLMLFHAQGFPAAYLMIMAVATSLATIIVTSLASIWAHQRLGTVPWGAVWRLAPGVLLGGLAGAAIADKLPGETLRMVFAVFMLYVGVQMALQKKPKPQQREPGIWLLGCAGTVIGALSGILGIGGGTLTVPLLVKFNYPMRSAVAASSACGLPIAISGTVGYALLGWQKPGLPDGSLGYVYLPAFFGIVAASMLFAPLGARLAKKLPTQKLKRYFAVLLFAVAAKLLWH